MTLIRRNYGKNHAYYDDPGNGQDPVHIPGVTTILGTALPPNLKNWAAEQSASYAVEHWEELATLPLLERGRRIQWAHRSTSSSAAAKGTEIHTYAEQLAHGETVDIPDELAGYVEACAHFLEDFDVQPVLSEKALINRTVGYAGTLDLVADVTVEKGARLLPAGTHRVIIDWKTGKGVYATAALQLSAYAHAERYLATSGVELDLQPLCAYGAIVHLKPDTYDVYPVDIGDASFLLFRHAARLAREAQWDKDSGAPMDRYLGAALDRPVRA